MNLRRVVPVIAMAMGVVMVTTISLPAQEQKKQHTRYKLIDLGTLGGTRSYFSPGSGNDIGQFSHVLNDRGAVAGFTNTSLPDLFPNFCFDPEGDCLRTHSFEAHDGGGLTDLGALPGGGSSASTWISSNGLIAGLSQNGQFDPLFNPAFPPFPENQAVLWKDNEIISLGALPRGGYESYAAAVNSRGQVVGAATNTMPDPNSMAPATFWLTGRLGNLPYEYQVRAFLWEKGKGMEDLGTLPGGTDAQAILINEVGQVVGYSYNGSALSSGCAFPLVTGSFIWEKEKGMKDLGNLGGTCTTATDLNDRGQIVGVSNLDGDQSSHAFLWDHDSIHDLGGSLGGSFTGAFALNEAGNAVGFAFSDKKTFHAVLWKQIGRLTDLGVVGPDQCSNADSINKAMQVVGSSISGCSNLETANFRAFLWEDGSIFDLNALIPSDSSLYLQSTETINNRGEIAGMGVDHHGNEHAFLLIPCDANDASDCQEVIVGATETSTDGSALLTQRPQIISPSNSIRQMLSRRLGPVPHVLTPIGVQSEAETTQTTLTATPLTITSGTPPSGTVGNLYDLRCFSIFHCLPMVGFPVTAAGGVQPYSWYWTAQQGSSLPPGLKFPISTTPSCWSAICGRPTTAGSYHVVVTVKDSESPPHQASASYTIQIFP